MLFDRYVISGSNGDDYDPSVVRHHHHHHHHHLDLSTRTPAESFGPLGASSSAFARHLLPPTTGASSSTSPPLEQQQQQQQQQSHPPQHPNQQPPPPTLPSIGPGPGPGPGSGPGVISDSTSSTATMEQFTTEQLLQEMVRLREPVCELDIRDDGVYAKTNLHSGTRYGPFPVKLCQQPGDLHLAWRVHASNFSGWLEPSSDVVGWLKKIRAVQEDEIEEANLQNFIMGGYLWYETNRFINAGSEIVVDGRPKTPYEINDNCIGAAAAAAAAAVLVAASGAGAGGGGGPGSSGAGSINNILGSLPSDDRSDRDNGECLKIKGQMHPMYAGVANNKSLACVWCKSNYHRMASVHDGNTDPQMRVTKLLARARQRVRWNKRAGSCNLISSAILGINIMRVVSQQQLPLFN